MHYNRHSTQSTVYSVVVYFESSRVDSEFHACVRAGLGVLTLLVGVLACCAAALTSRLLNAFVCISIRFD